jgi:phosphoglycerate dehydrogenase-like enzyme
MASLNRHKTIFTTERGLFHQERALVAAPESLDVVMLREPDRETLLAQLADAEFFISERTGVIDAEMIQAAPKLKLILRLGSLTYDIDTEAAKARGVAVCYWPVEGVIRVAEHMVMQMLVLAKRLRNAEAIALQASPEWGESRRGDEDTFAYNWSNRQGIQQLWGRTVGILGFGEIGAELARRLDGWGCALLYNKRRRLPETVEQELKLNYVDMDTLTSQSDYLAMLLPYSKIMDMSVNAGVFCERRQRQHYRRGSTGRGGQIGQTRRGGPRHV